MPGTGLALHAAVPFSGPLPTHLLVNPADLFCLVFMRCFQPNLTVLLKPRDLHSLILCSTAGQ
jgi:hypothetical protein